MPYPPCEDAPCCGCCGTNLYGTNEDNGDPRSDAEIKQATYDRMMADDYDEYYDD